MIILNSFEDWREFCRTIKGKADDRTENIDQILLAVLGAIPTYMDPGTDLKIREKNGRTANIVWAKIGGKTYAFKYSHETHHIEVHLRTSTGDIVATFDNRSTVADVVMFFTRIAKIQLNS